MIAVVAPLAAALVTVLLIAWMLAARDRTVLDIPGERSLHRQPVPRSGGIAMMTGVFAGFAIAEVPLAIVVPAAALVAVSYFEDLRGVPIVLRIGAQLLAAAAFVWAALADLPWPLAALIAIGIVWCANLYNFMDGADGLAGGMAVLGFGALAIAAVRAGAPDLALACTVVVAGAAAFLCFNFPPARIFMGDAGSVPLGFLAAAMSLAGWRRGAWPFWFPLAVFSPFAADATVTLAARILRGERFWLPHKTHYYQRLVQLGLGHRGTAAAEYALMIACAALALWTLGRAPAQQWASLALLVALYALLARAVDRAWRRRRPQPHDEA